MIPIISILLIVQVSGQDPYLDRAGPDTFYPKNEWNPSELSQQQQPQDLLQTNLDPFFLSDAAIPSNSLASNGLEISHYAKPKPKTPTKAEKHTRPVMTQSNIVPVHQLMGMFTGRVHTTTDLLVDQFTGEGAAPLLNNFKDVGRRRFGQLSAKSMYGGLIETKQPIVENGRCTGRPRECKGGCCIDGKCSLSGRSGMLFDACRQHISENGKRISGIWYKTDACPCQVNHICMVVGLKTSMNDNGFCIPG